MHQRLKFTRDESVVDEEIFFNSENIASTTRVAPLEISGPIVLHSMPQDQVLSAGWCTNRISLDKQHPMQGALQSGRRKQALGDHHPPQVADCDRHDEILPNPVRVSDGRS
jgi:hypothetical protein